MYLALSLMLSSAVLNRDSTIATQVPRIESSTRPRPLRPMVMVSVMLRSRWRKTFLILASSSCFGGANRHADNQEVDAKDATNDQHVGHGRQGVGCDGFDDHGFLLSDP